DRLRRRGDPHDDVPVEPPRLFRADDLCGIEASHLGCDPDREAAGVERADEVDPALPGDCSVPGRAAVVAERGDRSEPGDDDPAHWPQSLATRYRPAMPGQNVPFPPIDAQLLPQLP